jgi:putative phosphoribosyl transferase
MQTQYEHSHSQHSEDELSSYVQIPAGRVVLAAELLVPSSPGGIVVFAHGSGSSRKSPRNRSVADTLVHEGLATLLFDLLTPEEEQDRQRRFEISLLAERVIAAVEWVERNDRTADLPVGLFGASTGAAAALVAATHMRNISAVVSRGGRPDLADDVLPDVPSPTLFIVGGADPEVLELNRHAVQRMTVETRLHVVDRATHLFEEPGALRDVTEAAVAWFHKHLIGGHARSEPFEIWDH